MANIEEAERRIREAAENGLTILDLAGLGLEQLPDAIGNLTSLETLYLGGNQLTAVPDAIGNLTSLKELRLDSNQLTAVPDAIGNLTSLEALYLSGNQFTAVPDAIGKLTSLKTLWLHDNQLTVIPDAIGNLTSLKTLFLSGNQLTAVPNAIGNLTSLETVTLYGNQLTAVPDAIGNLTSLETLALNDSPLPDDVLKLADDLDSLRTYLRSLREGVPQYEAKVLLVGEGNVGKTCLLRVLRGEPFKKRGRTTRGIEIHPIEAAHASVPAGSTLRLNCWDFGGAGGLPRHAPVLLQQRSRLPAGVEAARRP